jgi:hypothetical protein
MLMGMGERTVKPGLNGPLPKGTAISARALAAWIRENAGQIGPDLKREPISKPLPRHHLWAAERHWQLWLICAFSHSLKAVQPRPSRIAVSVMPVPEKRPNSLFWRPSFASASDRWRSVKSRSVQGQAKIVVKRLNLFI